VTTFRISYRASGISLPIEGEPPHFRYETPIGIVYVEFAKDPARPSERCRVSTDLAIPPEVQRDLEILADRRLPPGGPDAEIPFIRDNLQAHDRFSPAFTLPIRFLPAQTGRWLTTLEDTLSDYAQRTASVLRWQFGMPGRARPLSEPRYEFSFDGAEWKPLPYEIPRPERGLISWPYDAAAHDGIEAYVQRGRGEPLAHEMYREAIANRIDNPRSCLALAVAAAEVGIKQTAAAAAPAARWLLVRGPSPSAIELLTRYLPTLPIYKFRGAFVQPTAAMKKNLGAAVTARNALVHAGMFGFTTDSLIELLDSIHDLIWLLAFYNGQVWALSNVSAREQREVVRLAGARDLGELAETAARA